MKNKILSIAENTQLATLKNIILFAFLSIVTATSLDVVLPAYRYISFEFGYLDAAELQKNILLFIVGMFFGELVFGFLSDIYGRKKVLILSLAIFIVGCLVSYFSASFFELLLGRVIQGAGAAGQKVCTRAIIRDLYSGSEMARVSSFITTAFVLVPFLAPTLGIYLVENYGWRFIFVFLFLFALIMIFWFKAQQGETLVSENKNTAGARAVGGAFLLFISNVHSCGYTLIAGLLFGLHLAFISLAAVFFSDMFPERHNFALYFGAMSSAFGAALLLNGFLVTRLGMIRLTMFALGLMFISSLMFLLLLDDSINFYLFISFLFSILFGIGLVFGNIIALAMEPLGKIAGLGSAFSSSISSLVALVVSYSVGAFYDKTLLSFSLAVIICSLFSLLICIVATRFPIRHIQY